MKLEALGDAPSFGWLKCCVERAELVGVEVVQTSRTTSASGYASSTSHRIWCAKSTAVRRSVTSTGLQPPLGSQIMNRFRVPLRWYSVS